MTSNIESVESACGAIIGEKITAGRYGNTFQTEAGYNVGDPCYWMDDETYAGFRSAVREQEPEAYAGRDRDWVEIQFRGGRAFFIAVEDGFYCGCNVDSGIVAAVKLA